jgi:5-(carboxyamino)imidazole ribonucleotide mutase
MGSKSDWDAMKAAAEVLARFGVAHESRVVGPGRLRSGRARVGRHRPEQIIAAPAGPLLGRLSHTVIR